MIKTNNLKKIILILICLLGEISSLIFLYFIKYRTHDLALNQIKINYTGNILNLIIAASIILLLFILLINFSKTKLVEVQVYLNILFFSVFLLLILALLLSRDFYVLRLIKSDEYEFEKIVSVLVWLIYFLLKLFSLNYLLLKVLKVQRAVFPKNFILSSIESGLIILFAFVKIFIISKTGDEFIFAKNEKFDAIVVLGAAVWSKNIPSPIYEGRLKKSIELIKNHKSAKIFLTGSNAPFELSEAMVGKLYLLANGIDSTRIEIEENSTSTIEQIHFIKKELIGSNRYKKIIVVSDGFHLPRVIEIAKFLNVDLKVARSSLKIEFVNKIWYRIKESVLLSIFWLFAV